MTIVGARPQFIKCAVVSRKLRKIANEILVHTGQHYDDSMSHVFFRELGIPKPDYSLNVGSGPHGFQTAEMLRQIERVVLRESPDCVLVYGDTNSTLAGALAAIKLNTPVAHVEAGLRSFNRRMPEEINRVVTDHISSWLLCPTQTAVNNLAREGITCEVWLTGDVMYDEFETKMQIAERESSILQRLGLRPKDFLLVTVHRAENTDEPQNLRAIASALIELGQAGEKIVFPIHPRTRARLEALKMADREQLPLLDPVSYFDMLSLEKNAKAVLTDSGGVQKEAFWLSIPCITLREETEWVETVESKWNVLVGADKDRIVASVRILDDRVPSSEAIYEDGHASERIVGIIARKFGWNPDFVANASAPGSHAI